jgi:hypothetical protein
MKAIQMHKSLKLIDIIMRIGYLVIYFGAGIWALIFVDHYANNMTISFIEAQGRGELQVLGAAYFVSATVLLYQWIKGQEANLYINPAAVLTATLLSRLVSILKGDVNQMLITLILFEVVFAAWAFWFLARRNA